MNFYYFASIGFVLKINRAVQRNPGIFNGMVLMGPLIKPVEEVSTSQHLAVRIASFIAPRYQAISFPLVRTDFILLITM